MRSVMLVAWAGLPVFMGSVGNRAIGAQFLGPTPYLSFDDSPFKGVAMDWFYLEDFEDGLLNTPQVTASAGDVGVAPPWPTADSVDGDDGVIDGNGNNGWSWYSYGSHAFTFSFSADALGRLPTCAGIVWTDVGYSDYGFGYGHVVFEAFDAQGDSLGSVGPVLMGDGSAYGETGEDRFFGVTSSAGISAIQITMPESTDWEVDHLQYGLPEPSGLWLLALGVGAGMMRRRVGGR
jgi:hypothetical protein